MDTVCPRRGVQVDERKIYAIDCIIPLPNLWNKKMTAFKEFFEIADQLESIADDYSNAPLSEPVEKLKSEAEKLKRSFSGSWLGYHSRIYYHGFNPTPPGAHWSHEWGNIDTVFDETGSRGDWVEYASEEIIRFIYQNAGDPDLSESRLKADEAITSFNSAKSEILSTISIELQNSPDDFIDRLKKDLEEIKPFSANEIASCLNPSSERMTRDQIAYGQGIQTPPHIQVISEITAIEHVFGMCRNAAEAIKKIASHLERKSKRKTVSDRIGTNVFLGHGRSAAWRELKDFIQERLSLPCDEFNRVPVAGMTNITRLSEMLDAAAVAFLIMTAEDETVGGQTQARMNVIHEVGLFQGRLGFGKAIVLLEEGCEEFSNIQGLGQIRFPKDNIGAAFEEIRLVLEREELISLSL